MNRPQQLRRRIQLLTWLFIAGLVVSGAPAIPLRLEVDRLINLLGFEEWGSQPSAQLVIEWLFKVRDALKDTEAQHPFLFYGTDWRLGISSSPSPSSVRCAIPCVTAGYLTLA